MKPMRYPAMAGPQATPDHLVNHGLGDGGFLSRYDEFLMWERVAPVVHMMAFDFRTLDGGNNIITD